MAKSYKWLGGIGYILSFIPYVSIVSSIIVATAWILMGRDTRQRIFTVTGVLMILTFVLGIGLLISFFMMFLTVLQSLTSAPMGGEFPFRFFRNLSQMMAFVIMALVLGIIGIAALILEIISHFRAGKIFRNAWFKLAGLLRIITIIAVLISIPLMIIYVVTNLTTLATMIPGMTAGPAILTSLLSILWPIIVVAILGLLSTIFSIVAFFTIPEDMAPTQSQETPT